MSDSIRPSLLDRMHAGSTVLAAIGPHALPDPARAGRRLAAFADHGRQTRLALTADPERSRWPHRPDGLRSAVRTGPAVSSAADLLATGGSGTGGGLRVTVAGDYLLTEHDHGLGEVQLALISQLVITGVLRPDDEELHRRIGRRFDGLATAVAATFATNPARIRDVLDQIKSLPAPPAVTGSPAASTGPTGTVHATVTAAGLAELRAWRDTAAPGISVFSLVVAALTRGFGEAGIELDEQVTVPVGLRRYLPTGTNPLGNFVAGVSLPHRPGDDPADLQARLARTTASGRPVAGLARVSTRAALARFRRPAAAPISDGPTRLLFSGIGSRRELEALPWLEAGEPTVAVRVDPAPPADISVAVVNLAGTAQLSAYDTTRHDAEPIRRVLETFAGDPVKNPT